MKKKLLLLLIAGFTLKGCNYLDVVPDNVATIEYAFRTPLTAEKYLFTCYSWLPNYADPFSGNPAIAGADEIWFDQVQYNYNSGLYARGQQNIQNPLMDFWQGDRGGTPLFRGIHECNIFLDNVDKVHGLSDFDKAKMKAEAKFLKAYYHFYLLRMYGPIPIMHENYAVSTEIDDIKGITREPVDKVFQYIVDQLDEAIVDLPETVLFESTELGRITKPIAMAIKAKVLLTAASPLFNGNTDYSNYKNSRGEVLFNQTQDPNKWTLAADAAKEAIDYCESLGYVLHKKAAYDRPVSDTTKIELNLRTAITEKWNKELIWGASNSAANVIQTASYPRIFGGDALYYGGYFSVPLNLVEQFYSKNGVPINEDKSFDYTNRYGTKAAAKQDKQYIKTGYTTARLNFDREPRYYAFLGFDGGRWYGQGLLSDDENFYIEGRLGGIASGHAFSFAITGYLPKKLVNYQNTALAKQWVVQRYPWPIVRLADLYLMYAEALNEADGPSDEIFTYLDRVRERAGLKGVKYAWSNFSNQPEKVLSKAGLQSIIRQERTIELCFEGHRFWDLRRWKVAQEVLNQNIMGWDVLNAEARYYYIPRTVVHQNFQVRDYFWPIQESEFIKNKEIIQSPNW